MSRLVGLLAGLFRLRLSGSEDVADPVQRLASNDQASRDQSLAVCHHTFTSDLLTLRAVDAEDMVGRLLALDDGVENNLFALCVKLFGGLLERGQAFVDLVQSSGAKVVGLLDIRRDIFVRPGEDGQEGLAKGLEGRIANLYRFLSIGVALEGRQGRVDHGVASDVLIATASIGVL